MRKKDLKQRSEVDIAVAQEIKNHKDLVSEQGSKIQGLSGGMIALSLQYEKLMNKSHSDLKNILIDFENLREGVDSTLKSMTQMLGNMETRISGLLDGLSTVQQSMKRDYVSQNEFSTLFDEQANRISGIELDLSIHKDGFNKAIVALNHKMKEEIERLKSELTPKPPEICPIQSKVDAVSESWKVDFDGLIKEIAILKKSVSYGEKKFENIYTLIDRLKSDGGGLFHKQV